MFVCEDCHNNDKELTKCDLAFGLHSLWMPRHCPICGKYRMLRWCGKYGDVGIDLSQDELKTMEASSDRMLS